MKATSTDIIPRSVSITNHTRLKTATVMHQLSDKQCRNLALSSLRMKKQRKIERRGREEKVEGCGLLSAGGVGGVGGVDVGQSLYDVVVEEFVRVTSSHSKQQR